MRELRSIHLRNGAFAWRLDEDLTRSNTYRIEVTVSSWTGSLLQRERLTKAEQELQNAKWKLLRVFELPKRRTTGAKNTCLFAPLTDVLQPAPSEVSLA